MLNRLLTVDNIRLQTAGTEVSTFLPFDPSSRKLPKEVVIRATGNGAYVRLSDDRSAATDADMLVQSGDHVVCSVADRRWVSVLAVSGSTTVSVGALSTGVGRSVADPNPFTQDGPVLDLVFAGVANDPLDVASTTDDTLELNFVAQAYQSAAQYAVWGWGTGGLQQVDFADIVTFSRTGSTATYFNSAGVLTTAAADVPRFDYDPSTLVLRGLLIEEQRANLLLNSDTLSTQSVTVTAVAHTLSFYGTGTITLSGASTSGPLTGSGAFPTRSTLTFTPTAGTLTLTVTGTVQYGQLEAGAFATSYIPTTSTQLTRNADVANINTLAPWYSQVSGTVYAEFINMVAGSATQTNGSQGVWGITQSALTGSFNGYAVSTNLTAPNTASLNFRSRYQPTGKNDSVNFGAGYLAATTAYKTAAAWDSSQITADSDVGVLATGTNNAAADMGTHDRMQLGNQNGGGGAPYQLNGWLRRISYYPRRLSNADLQTLTT